MTIFKAKDIEIPEGAQTLIIRGDEHNFLSEYGAGELGVKTLNKDWRKAVAQNTETELLFRQVTNPEDPTIPLLINGIIALDIEN